MTRIVLGDKHEKSLKAIPLSDNTVKRRIPAMSEDINEIKDIDTDSLLFFDWMADMLECLCLM